MPDNACLPPPGSPWGAVHGLTDNPILECLRQRVHPAMLTQKTAQGLFDFYTPGAGKARTQMLLNINACFDTQGVIKKGIQIALAVLTGQHTSTLFVDMMVQTRAGLRLAPV